MMEGYCDVIVLRHPEPGAAKVHTYTYMYIIIHVYT